MRGFERRLRRLEPQPPKLPAPPNVLEVRRGETEAEAYARFRQRWPNVKPGHTFMVVPAMITVEEWREIAAAKHAKETRLAQLSQSEG